MEDGTNMIDYLEHIREVHFNAIHNFRLYQKLMIARSPKLVGSAQAKKNNDTLNSYKGVFTTTRIATRYTSLMSAAILFTPGRSKNGDPSISLIDLMDRIDKLTTKSKEQTNELSNLQQGIQNHQAKIDALRAWRNQQMAHLDLNPDDVSMSDKDLDDLTGLSKKILALAEWCFEFTTLTLDQFLQNAHLSYLATETDIDWDFDKLLNKLQS